MTIQIGSWTVDPDEIAAYRRVNDYGYGRQGTETVLVVLKGGVQIDGSMDSNQLNTLLVQMNARKQQIKVTKE